MINTVSDLFIKAQNEIKNYPESTLRIPEMKHFGFFPGGHGIYPKESRNKTLNELKLKYMFLGQDFGTKKQFIILMSQAVMNGKIRHGITCLDS